MAAPIFTREVFQFLGELALNNDREWFAANKQRYEDHVREPALALVRAMEAPLRRVSKQFIASDRKVGGSLMRIYRDVRFSREKTPYKTNVGIQFRHSAGKDIHAPGLYVHIEPGEMFLGAGLWHPDREALAAIRKAIVAEPKKWKRVSRSKKFLETWSLTGESLKRPPRGFDGEHPLVEDLKRKDHIAVAELAVDELLSPDLPKLLAARYATAKPYVRFLVDALDLAF
ncbi:MAG: DUF2461 domain-containing protein [Nannocystaceae bacterium]